MTDNTWPLVSIITPSFNQAKYIEDTILSVRQQDYPHIEHIVIDGGSTDGTLDILQKYEDKLTWISEKDGGQADAINKGFRRATGDIFGWVNSDDFYVPGAIRTVVEHFQTHPQDSFIYGDAEALDESGKSYGIRTHVKQGGWQELVGELDFIVQPASFWRANLWKTCGELDESLHYTLDYEYWMRAARQFPPRYIPVLLAKERLYAAAKTFSGAVTRMEEIEMVARRHGGSGLPYNYRAEAAANYALRAFSRLKQRQWAGANEDLGRALSIRPPFMKFAKYFGALALLGPESLSGLWLGLNQRRAGQKAGTEIPKAN
ncbi:MAG: glycosyltransferase family 2 protein [Anaerolineae bacterium]